MLLLMLLLVYVGAGTYLYLKQRSFMYFPAPALAHDFPTEQVASHGETIELAVVNPGEPQALLYFGGNAEPVVANASAFAETFPEFTVYLVNYRGYGGSSGMPSEKGLYQDAQTIFDTIKDRHDSISVIGRSLGSGVATHLAANRPLSKLLLITPFDSILNIARSRYPLFPVSLFLKDHYDSHARVPQIEEPTLVVLAEHDAIVKPERSERLIGAFPPSQVEVKTLQGAGHNKLHSHPAYFDAMRAFVVGK